MATVIACACLAASVPARAGQSIDFHAAFSPDRLGASTNLSLSAKLLSSPAEPPPPVSRFLLYGPAGLGVDARGAGVCPEKTLTQMGPRGCPASSRAGFGGGVGLLEFPSETLHVPFTLDFFFAPRVHGHLRLLVYVSAVSPIGVEFVLLAREVPAPKPYGLGLSIEVPPISTFPGAKDISIESAFVTVGGSGIAYYEQVGGKRTLVHVRGLIVPKHCPAGGFPTEGEVFFSDGSSLTANPTIPCPRR